MYSALNNTKPKPQETDNSESTAQKTSTANTNNNTTATATPVEAAGKPRKFKNLVIRVKSKLNEVDKKKWDSSNSSSSSSTITNSSGCQKSCDSTILQNISNSAVISSNKFESSKETMTSSQECTTNNSGIETKYEIEEERCDSRQSQRSLSPLSVGPIPVPPATQKSTTVPVDAPSDFPPGIREIPITLTSTTYNQMLQQKYEEQMSSSTTTTTTNQLAHQNSGNCSSKKMREFDTAQWADKNLTAKPYCSVNGAKSEAASHEKSSKKEVDKKEFEACEMRSVNMSGDTSGACLPDPSIILLSPTPSHNKKDYLSRSESEKSFEIIDNLHEEVHHVKEDKARALLNDKLKDSIHDMVAYQKYEGEEKSHFQELKTKQKTCQKDFHEKLYNELTKESGSKTSYVAEALNLTQGKSTNEDNQLQSSSVPSHSPVTSRRGSQTWQYKSQLWCNSLPRKKQRVKFEDDTNPPARPPPPVDENKPPAEQPIPPARSQQSINQQNTQTTNQTNAQSINQTNAQPVYNAPQPPARQQSINTMKNLSPITSAYNNALIETTKAINNGTFTTDTLTDSYNHTHKQATPKDNINVNNDHKQAPPTFLTKKSTNTNWVNEDPYRKKLDYNLEFDEIYEHEPVHSTDRLEKPRHINPPQASARPGYASCTLPRKRINFNGASPGDLKRNNSMSDLPLTPSPEPGCQKSWPSSNQIFRREHNSFTTPKGCLSRSGSTELKPPKSGPSEQGSRSCTPDQRNQNQNLIKQENNSNNQNDKAKDNSKNYDINENVSVPLHVVKAVVLSVLEKQGVPNPSDDVINKAIQEFYSKQNSISDF